MIRVETQKFSQKARAQKKTTVYYERKGNYEERPVWVVGVWRTTNYRVMANGPTTNGQFL